MLKNRYRIRCLFFFLSVPGLFLPGYLKAVEYPFFLCWYEVLKEGAYFDEDGNKKYPHRRTGAKGNIIQEHDSNDARILTFRLARQSSAAVVNNQDSPGYINTELSVEISPINMPDNEHFLIPVLTNRIPGAGPNNDPVAHIQGTLDSLQISAAERRAFISAIAGSYTARITGFRGEAVSVARVSFLEELVQLLLLLKSRISSEDQFRELVNAVTQVSPPLFLPEAMVFNQFFPLVRINALREARDNFPLAHAFAAELNLYRDSAMNTNSQGVISFGPNRGESRFFLRNLDDSDAYTGRWVSVDRPSSFSGEGIVNRWFLPAFDDAQLNAPLPDIQELPQRFPAPLFDSGYGSKSR